MYSPCSTPCRTRATKFSSPIDDGQSQLFPELGAQSAGGHLSALEQGLVAHVPGWRGWSSARSSFFVVEQRAYNLLLAVARLLGSRLHIERGGAPKVELGSLDAGRSGWERTGAGSTAESERDLLLRAPVELVHFAAGARRAPSCAPALASSPARAATPSSSSISSRSASSGPR